MEQDHIDDLPAWRPAANPRWALRRGVAAIVLSGLCAWSAWVLSGKLFALYLDATRSPTARDADLPKAADAVEEEPRELPAQPKTPVPRGPVVRDITPTDNLN